MRAPMAWFDQTLSGRILARFSHDTQVLDWALTVALSELVVCWSSGALVLACAMLTSSAAVAVVIIAVIQPWGCVAALTVRC